MFLIESEEINILDWTFSFEIHAGHSFQSNQHLDTLKLFKLSQNNNLKVSIHFITPRERPRQALSSWP